MNTENDTNSERIRQGISACIQVVDDAEHQQFGKKAYNTTNKKPHSTS